ncbi:ABC transporter ATP-binding protein [Amycolatopsis antarctica]|uniref:ABC transporter ATP-binding protein n=1 Tax=Amycolatopsis antarctica TaxID=1854586 RepID=A0A263D278_9PSEU|nr:ABC transporter ATP-binding protein [Amycolatopsis antarctica]OZM72572.1 ABC transporter ATP-binding protein [Amycolatopsis antarctica]
MTLLRVRDLGVTAGGSALVSGVDLEIGAGERVGLIGESGSGKSLTASALLGLLPDGLTATGSATLGEVELVGAGERTMSSLRGRELAMVFQEPMTALNPSMRVGRQVAEAMLVHGTRSGRRDAHRRAVELLGTMGLPDPERTARTYPHQLSGGQRQRVVLAIALANDPPLLVCDEPTTALDVTVQARILDEIRSRTTESGTALLFITHDLAVVAGMCERVLVMHEGRVVESGTTHQVLSAPEHDYTRKLLAASDLETA